MPTVTRTTDKPKAELPFYDSEFDDQERARHNALADRDAAEYYELCDELGITPEDEFLFEQGQMECQSDLEMIASHESAEARLEYHKGVPRNWAIRQKDLRMLPYRSLEDIFYGIHNLDIPAEMLDRMNPDEMLSKWLAAGQLKRYNNHLNGGIPSDFSALYRMMDSQAYSMGSFRRMADSCKRRFSCKPGDQGARLAEASRCSLLGFVESFFDTYTPSDREDPSNPDAFHDPNFDGSSKEAYVRGIYTKISAKWDMAEQELSRPQ
jgi:hypothetical protein